MKFSLTTDVTARSSVETLSPLALAELENDLAEAYENLDSSIRGLKEVTDVMDNIQTSLRLLSIYGQSAVPQLNVDKGLEALMGVPENLITVEKATEEMEEQKKSLWQKFKEMVIRVWTAIKNFFFSNSNNLNAKAEAVKKASDEVADKTFVGTAEMSVDCGPYANVAKSIELWSGSFISMINEAANILPKLTSLIDEQNMTADAFRDQVKSIIISANKSIRPYGIQFAVSDGEYQRIVLADLNANELLLGEYKFAKTMIGRKNATYDASGWTKDNWIKAANTFSEQLKNVASKYQYFSDENKKFENELIRKIDALSSETIKKMTPEDDIKDAPEDAKKHILRGVVILTHSYVNAVHRLESELRDAIEAAIKAVKQDCLS